MNLIPRNSLLDFDNIFNGFWSPSREIGESTDVAFSPRVDIEEKDDQSAHCDCHCDYRRQSQPHYQPQFEPENQTALQW